MEGEEDNMIMVNEKYVKPESWWMAHDNWVRKKKSDIQSVATTKTNRYQ